MRPTRAGLVMAAAFLAMAIAQLFFEFLQPFWMAPGIVLALVALVDALLLIRRPVPQIRRQMSHQTVQDKTITVRLVVDGPLPPCILGQPTLVLYDGLPHNFAADAMPLVHRPDKQQRQKGFVLSYGTSATRRGRYRIEPCFVEYSSPLKFWWRRSRSCSTDELAVYPDHRRLLDAFHIGGEQGASTGNHTRKRGLGLEFHQLREYQQGDMMRMVDPKASSRVGKLIVREMQEEEDQQILFLLDTGNRMMAMEEGKSHFDQAFEAMLTMAWVALRQGDRVGVRTWGPSKRWVPERRGTEAFSAMVRSLYDLEPSPEASSPSGILAEVLPRLKRRTLIVLLSNFREEDSEDMQQFLPLLRSRHLLCTVWLREAIVEELASRDLSRQDEALETAMARRYLEERKRCRARWEDAGILTIDTVPSSLSGRLLQQYWEIKASGRL